MMTRTRQNNQIALPMSGTHKKAPSSTTDGAFVKGKKIPNYDEAYASTATFGAPAKISAFAKSAYFSKFFTNFSARLAAVVS